MKCCWTAQPVSGVNDQLFKPASELDRDYFMFLLQAVQIGLQRRWRLWSIKSCEVPAGLIKKCVVVNSTSELYWQLQSVTESPRFSVTTSCIPSGKHSFNFSLIFLIARGLWSPLMRRAVDLGSINYRLNSEFLLLQAFKSFEWEAAIRIEPDGWLVKSLTWHWTPIRGRCILSWQNWAEHLPIWK